MATTTQPAVRTTGTPVPIGHSRGPMATVAKIARWAALLVTTLVFLVPFYLIVRNALSTDADITAPGWKVFPSALQWGNIAELFNDSEVPMARALWNSAVVGVLGTGGQLLLAAMAGYGLARIPHRAADKIFYLIVATLMIPAAVTFIPSFVLVSSLGWVSSLRGLIIPGLFSGFAAFLFRQYFINFPKELEEAARVDGLGYWRTFWLIVVPNSLPFCAAIAAITFIANWNAFLWPLVIGQDSSSWTVQVALSTFVTAQTINIHELFVAAGVSILPLVLIFVFLQRYLVQGVAETGIKG
ncbi:multiple sugar transport system permease protein [Actinopolymorpha cephalotaxi]|uniref:Multiple sugar transport system permease protein n=1 Tax=Actinopolymorpha cephalotaxi TaxID=504797 RepID=A0A1I2YEW8_9ACTN|nr:carbohydrate ABC transporter permease [Actinopolymorpha cephalotaxi]NYH87026.1 multiple sugar transport system permease protein [Actinopolymorpha cephalotaxi]SFH23656.1 multiple sugar transport system permease protein [Actinopolymorpha cephalotaxi]